MLSMILVPSAERAAISKATPARMSGDDIRSPRKGILTVEAYHCGPVGITENDFSSHVDQFVDKEKPAFKHLLVNKNASPGLSCNNQNDADKVRE
jgi:hypothetical protein